MAFKKKSKEPKRKFKFKKRTAEQVRRHQQSLDSGGYDSIFKKGFRPWRAKEGKNRIRVLPSTWDNDDNHYAMEIWTHPFIGPPGQKAAYLCLAKMKGEKCASCEIHGKLLKEEEKEEANQYRPVRQFACWILDRRADDDKWQPVPYAMPQSVDKQIVDASIDDDTGSVEHVEDPDQGYDVILTRKGKNKNTDYTAKISRSASRISEDDEQQEEVLQFVMQNPIPDILEFKPYEYLKKLLDGETDEPDEDADDDEDEDEDESRSSKRGKRLASSYSEDDEDEDDDEESDEEDERRMKKRKLATSKKLKQKKSSKKKEEPEDDEEEESEDDDEADSDRGSRRAGKRGGKVSARRSEPDEDDSDDDEDGEEAEDDDSEDTEEDDADGEDDGDSDNDSEDEEESRPSRGRGNKRAGRSSGKSKRRVVQEDEDDEEEEDESDEDDEDSEEDEQPSKRTRLKDRGKKPSRRGK